MKTQNLFDLGEKVYVSGLSLIGIITEMLEDKSFKYGLGFKVLCKNGHMYNVDFFNVKKIERESEGLSNRGRKPFQFPRIKLDWTQTNKAIAKVLMISELTVHALRRRLGIKSNSRGRVAMA